MTTKEQVIELVKMSGCPEGFIGSMILDHGHVKWIERLVQLAQEAYRSKLLAGVGEPSCASEWGGRETGPCLYTADQLAAAVLVARNAALEDSAKAAEEYETSHDITLTWQNIIATGILNLKETE